MAFPSDGPHALESSALAHELRKITGEYSPDNRKSVKFVPQNKVWAPNPNVTSSFVNFAKTFKSVGAFVPEQRFYEVELHWLQNLCDVLKSHQIRFGLAKIADAQTLTFVKKEDFENLVSHAKWKIKEPECNNLDTESFDPELVLVPSWIVDKSFHRIGRGGGFYDRYIYKMRSQKTPAKFIALVHPEFFVDQIPKGLKQPLDAIVDGVLSAHFFVNNTFKNPMNSGEN